ncbi:hypothetical protein H5410_050030 [Solanum commersonii]|uniref:Uncharacterized protein n=1 Tax=Solanum commersonii TaxID=4109 RepID=A0A9J5WU68_SOLCO|nr:hypothetical protein H5410_050030 [Solanum commersonii]
MHICKTSQSSIFISYENQKPNQCQIKKQKVGKLNTIKEETVPFTPLKCESQNAQFFVNSIEPFTSEYMYLPLLPNQEEEFEMDKIFQSSELDRIEFSSMPTSIIESPFCREWDLSVYDQLDVHDPNSMINISEYFT